MLYLQPSEYESYGLDTTTAESWITTASAVIDAHCRRSSLGVTEYKERIRLRGRMPIRLTYLPLIAVEPALSPIIEIRVRYGVHGYSADISSSISAAFGLPGTWGELSPANVDFEISTGEISIPFSPIGLGYDELEVTYTAGLNDVPNAVKSACAQLVRNAQATPALNVRESRMDRMQLQYFEASLVDDEVRKQLAPYVAVRMA